MRPLSKPGTQRRRPTYYVLLIVTLLAVTLITLDARDVVALSSVRDGAVDVLSPVRGAARWVTTPLRNAWNGVTGYEDLEDENEQLRAELDELRNQELQGQDAISELGRLEAQLGLEVGDLDSQVARVTAGPFSNFTDHTLQLDRGRNSGLDVGMPVINKGGLVGRVVDVSETRSVVQTITDPDLTIGIRLASSGVIGTGHGGGNSDTFIGEVGIDLGEPIQEKEPVLTGGFERSIMPPGIQIAIGTVRKATPDEATRVQLLQIDYAVDFDRLDVVQVVKWTPES